MITVLGAIIAGGRSLRYGSPKPLVPVGGERLVDRVRAALAEAADDVVVIANDPLLAQAIGLPWRPDELRDLGGLAGVHAALCWASERGAAGVLAAAADMPLLSVPLLRRLRELGAHGWEVAIPESNGPRGLEPLCAFYAVACIPAIEQAAARQDARMIGFHDAVRVCRVPLQEERAYGDPAALFMNINTPADHEAAERLLAERTG